MSEAAMDRFEIRLGEEGYPESVAELPDPPSVLYGRGDPSALSTPALSIIGSRRASPYGIAVAELTGRIAAESGVTVVSGGARGCDQAAGRAALDAGGRHVVVLGTGSRRRVPRHLQNAYRPRDRRVGMRALDRALGDAAAKMGVSQEESRHCRSVEGRRWWPRRGCLRGRSPRRRLPTRWGARSFAAPGSIFLARVAGVELSHRQRGVLHRRRRVPRGGDLEDLRNVALLPGRCSRPFGGSTAPSVRPWTCSSRTPCVPRSWPRTCDSTPSRASRC